MTSRVTIFDRTGAPLTTLRVATSRSWVLNGIGEATFQIAYTDPKCKREYLEFGNRVLIEHPKMPDWVGVIDTPRDWGNSSVTVRAYDACSLLSWRRGRQGLTMTGTAGSLFKQIILFANQVQDIGLRPGTIYLGGTDRQETVNDSLWQHMSNICGRSGNDFIFTPRRDAGRLVIDGNWYQRAGEPISVILSEGKNIELGNDVLTEDGRIVNDLLGYGEGATYETRIEAYGFNLESANRYDLRQSFATYSGNSELATLQANVNADLALIKSPQTILQITALDVGNTFAGLRLGNTMPVRLHSIGFTGSGRGYEATVRIYGMRYTDTTQKVDLVTKEQ